MLRCDAKVTRKKRNAEKGHDGRPAALNKGNQKTPLQISVFLSLNKDVRGIMQRHNKEKENGARNGQEPSNRTVDFFVCHRFRGLWYFDPELMELFFSRICIVGTGSWLFLADKAAEMARVTSVRTSAQAAPMAV